MQVLRQNTRQRRGPAVHTLWRSCQAVQVPQVRFLIHTHRRVQEALLLNTFQLLLAIHLKSLVAVTADRAPQHRSKMVKEFLRNNRDVKMIYLPKCSPYLNAMEECWHQEKRILLVSEYYKTFQDMHLAVSLYYRTVRFKLDLLNFTSRKYDTAQTFDR